VTVVVELKARFDEEANINWAEMLESIGAQVLYGVVGSKTHAKMMLITRREGKSLGGAMGTCPPAITTPVRRACIPTSATSRPTRPYDGHGACVCAPGQPKPFARLRGCGLHRLTCIAN
jgi:hypothetical protein